MMTLHILRLPLVSGCFAVLGFACAASCQIGAERDGRGGNVQAGGTNERTQQVDPEDPQDLGRDQTDLPGTPEEPLLPLEEQQRAFEIVEGDDRGEFVELELRRAESHEPGEWVLELGDLNVLYLEEDEEGNILAVRMDLPREEYRLEYEPAVRLVPSKIEPELREDERAEARIYNLDGELQHTGEATHMIKSVTRARFHRPNGDTDGYMVVIEHEIDLGLADVSMELESGYLPGEGMVYRRIRYTITRLGIFGTTTRQTAVVAE